MAFPYLQMIQHKQQYLGASAEQERPPVFKLQIDKKCYSFVHADIMLNIYPLAEN